MTIALKAFDDLDATLVEQTLSETKTSIEEDNATLDLRSGPLFQIIAYYGSLLSAQRMTLIKDYLNGRSLKAISEDPTLADTDLVNDVLSNFGITRAAGEKAQGSVTIIVSDDVSVVIAAGAVFVGNGKRFLTETVFTAKSDEDQLIDTTDRLLSKGDDGNWYFTIDLVAEEVGADFEVKKDTALIPNVLPSNYVNSYATSDFIGGLDEETNSELITRLQLGISPKVFGNRVNMLAMLKAEEEFSRITASSIIGYGDPEMLRNKHSVVPIAFGGRCDWYIRSQEEIYALRVTKNATFVEIDEADGYGVWSLSITRDDGPGFYKVQNIQIADSNTTVDGGFTIVSDTRGYDITGTKFTPDIVNTTEAAYSYYQTASVLFKDTVTDVSALSVGNTKSYQFELRGMPLIGEIQAFVNQRDVRHWSGDCLIKAPIPCFVRINLVVEKKATAESPTITDIQTAVVRTINQVGFTGKLYASSIVNVVQSYLKSDVNVAMIDMFGLVTYPSGTEYTMQSSEVLTIPDLPREMVSARTVQFFSTADDVIVNVKTAILEDF